MTTTTMTTTTTTTTNTTVYPSTTAITYTYSGLSSSSSLPQGVFESPPLKETAAEEVPPVQQGNRAWATKLRTLDVHTEAQLAIFPTT